MGKKEQEIMKDEYEAEIDYLKKQVSGDATTKDTREFIDKLKESNKKRVEELEKLVDQLMKEKSKLNKENADLTNRNKKLKADFDKTLSKEKLQELIKDYPVKIHEERDELLIKVDQLAEEKRELEQELDDIRKKALSGDLGYDVTSQDKLDLLKKEQDIMKDEYEAEIDYLKKQVSGDATTKDTRVFIDKLKESNKKRVEELEKLVDQLMKEKSKLNKENADLTNRNKKLKADFDKTLSKEKLQELIKDYPVKIHEERDELLIKVDQLTEEKKELEQELDELRMKGYKDSTTGDSSLQDSIDLLKKEQELMKDEYESEIN